MARVNRVVSHIAMPAVMGVLFFAVALSPVNLLGCRTRGLAALSVAFASALWALASAVGGGYRRMRGDPQAIWWMARTLILTIPVIALYIMA
jgi:hypothetical protein